METALAVRRGRAQAPHLAIRTDGCLGTFSIEWFQTYTQCVVQAFSGSFFENQPKMLTGAGTRRSTTAIPPAGATRSTDGHYGAYSCSSEEWAALYDTLHANGRVH